MKIKCFSNYDEKLKIKKQNNQKILLFNYVLLAFLTGNFVTDVNQKFIRKGQVGDWKNHFTEEMNQVNSKL
jgi:hypothetical protein